MVVLNPKDLVLNISVNETQTDFSLPNVLLIN